MEENCLVSIITPMYNAKQYISETIESVIAQVYTNWEMIIVDDGSTDESPKVVQEYAKKDARIRYYRQQKNGGIAKARNTAIGYARGRYVAFLDSDDLWKPDKLQKQLVFMEKEGAHFSHTACGIIDGNGLVTGKVRHVPKTIDYKHLLRGNGIACLTVVIDRKYIDKIAMPDIPHEDYAMWLDIMKRGEIAWGLDDELAEYRVAQHSVSNNKLRAAGWTWNIYRHYLQLPIWKAAESFICYMWKAVVKRV